MIHSLQLFFSLRAFADSGLKQGAKNLEDGFQQMTAATMHRNRQDVWQSFGDGETKIRDLRGLDHKRKLKYKA